MAEDDPTRGDSRPRPVNEARGGSGTDTGWSVVGTMLSGMAVWGGAGWLLDRWLGIEVFLPVGVILGMAASIYVVVVRYGGAPPSPAGQRAGKPPGGRRSRPRTQKGQR
jgi:hypothetical protein